MAEYRKKPVIVEAIQFTGEQSCAIIELWAGGRVFASPVLEPTKDNPSGLYLQVDTLEGISPAIVGDWIIKGIKGEFYPCKPDIFAMTYESSSTLPSLISADVVEKVEELLETMPYLQGSIEKNTSNEGTYCAYCHYEKSAGHDDGCPYPAAILAVRESLKKAKGGNDER